MASLSNRSPLVFLVAASLVVAAAVVGWKVFERPSPEDALLRSAAKGVKLDEGTYLHAAKLVDKAQANGKLSEEEFKELQSMLTHEHFQMRQFAIKGIEFGLGSTNPEAAVASILPLLADEADAVKASAMIAIYGIEPKAWLRRRPKDVQNQSPAVQNVVKYLDGRYSQLTK